MIKISGQLGYEVGEERTFDFWLTLPTYVTLPTIWYNECKKSNYTLD